MQPDALIAALNAEMKRHGYTMVSAAPVLSEDATAIRYVVAGDNVLAERLKPIVIKVSGLDLIRVSDVSSYARLKVEDAMAGATPGVQPGHSAGSVA